MIRQSTVLMATPIALLANDNKIKLSDKVSDVILGLNHTTASLTGFTESNIATELPDYTQLVPDHTEALELSTTVMADAIRVSLNTISKHIKPIMLKMDNEIRRCNEDETIIDSIFHNTNISLVNIEPSFFNSPFYPKTIPNLFSAGVGVKVSDLVKGTWPAKTGAEIKELIDAPIADILPFLYDDNKLNEVWTSLFVYKDWGSFISFDGDMITHSNINKIDFRHFESYVIGSLIVNKLCSMDDPIEGVTGVSLDDYRTHLIITRDFLNTVLVKFKEIWTERAKSGIVILNDDTRIEKKDYGALKGYSILTGSVVVGYNNKILEFFSKEKKSGLSEVIIGLLLAKIKSVYITDIITDIDKVMDLYKDYYTDVSIALNQNKQVSIKENINSVLDRLYEDEDFKPLIESLDVQTPLNNKLKTKLYENFDIDSFVSSSLMDEVIGKRLSLMNTVLAVKLCEVLNCPIGAEILKQNIRRESGTIDHQRKVLTRSIISVILKHLVDK